MKLSPEMLARLQMGIYACGITESEEIERMMKIIATELEDDSPIIGSSSPRFTVRQFAQVMEQQLKENDHKGGWQNCSPKWLLGRLYEEADELAEALAKFEHPSKIAEEAADIANFAMMIADVVGALAVIESTNAARNDLKTAQARVKELEYELLQLATNVWLQWGVILDDGRRDSDRLSTLKWVEKMLRKAGKIDERGRFAWEYVQKGGEQE